MKHNFKDKQEFEQLENLAIDGQLDYNDFKPAEYQYFSRLTRLGYLNRHKGWSKELCEIKQAEYRQDYQEACRERDGWLNHARIVQQRLIKTTTLSHNLNFAKTPGEALPIALELIEQLLEEPGLCERVSNNIKLKEEQT